MQPPDDFNPAPGMPVELAPGLRRLLCPNPSPMTYRGTNTYLLGTTEIAVIDPGPDDPLHLEAILDAIGLSARITQIIVTHSHLDHSPLSRALAQKTGAPVLAFGDATAGRSAIMSALAQSGLAGGGEGIDHAFRPDQILQEGDQVTGEGWSLEVLHTPGHLGNHISLAWGEACFTADHVMGWASSLVSPPDGDLTDFMASCRKMAARNWSVFYPGHGAPILDPNARLDWLISHRLEREAQIRAALETGSATAQKLAAAIYTDVAPALLPAAERNVFAHLIDLYGRDIVRTEDPLGIASRFALI